MPLFHALTRPAVALSVVALLALALAAGCSKSAETGSARTASAATQNSSASPANASSTLGDLSAFRRLATDVAALVDKGDLAAAKTRVKDLEIAWDAAEAGLKPRAAGAWHVLDKAIDHALKTLREQDASPNSAQAALSDLLKTFDSPQATP